MWTRFVAFRTLGWSHCGALEERGGWWSRMQQGVEVRQHIQGLAVLVERVVERVGRQESERVPALNFFVKGYANRLNTCTWRIPTTFCGRAGLLPTWHLPHVLVNPRLQQLR